MRSALIWALLLLPGAFGKNCGNGGGNLTVELNGTYGSDVITVGTPLVDFYLRMSCEPKFMDNDFYDFYELRKNKTMDNGTKISRIGGDDFFQGQNNICNTTIPRFQIFCSESNGTLQINVTMYNITEEDHFSSLALRSVSDFFSPNETVFELQLLVKYCSVDDLPSGLKTKIQATNLFSYGQTTNVICRENELFLNNTVYAPTIEASCMDKAQWVIPPHECAPACQDPSKGNLRVKLQPNTRRKTKYKYQTKVELICRYGRLYYPNSSNHFETTVPSVCQHSGLWSHDEVQCWTGNVVDFTNLKFDITSGQRAIFTCSAANAGNEVRMKVGRQLVTGKDHSWLNITVAPEHRGTVYCKEIDGFGEEIDRGNIHLNVLYPPFVEENESTRKYGLVRDADGHVVIEFRANPAVTSRQIRILRNGSYLTNFYVAVEDDRHSVVLHFLKVQEGDYGNYTMTVTSSRFRGKLEYGFTIYKDEPAYKGLTASGSAGLTLGVVLAIAAISGLVIILMRNYHSGRESADPKTGEECRNYENVDNNGAAIFRASEGRGYYVNTRMGSRMPTANATESFYETPISRATTARSNPVTRDAVYEYNN